MIAEIFFREQDRLRRIVAGLGLSHPDGDDVLQQVYLKARMVGPEMCDGGQAVRWLMKVTANECFEEHRRKKRFQRTAEQILHRQPVASSAGPQDAAIKEEELDMIRQALQQLDPTLLVPLALRYFSGLDSTEIGGILDLPAATVRGRLRDARLLLAKVLMKKGIEP